MTYLRSTLFHMCFWLWTLGLGVAAAPSLLSKTLTQRICCLWVDTTLWLLRVCCGLSLDVRGAQHIQNTPAIYASKHQSTLDTLALWKLLNGPAFILKKQLLWIPIYGWYLWRCSHIAIDRKAGRVALESINAQAQQMIDAGRSIIIFPEGTRTKPGEKRPYKTAGVSTLYESLSCPLVPVALNTGLFWPKRQYVKKAGKATIAFLPPVAAGLQNNDMVEAVRDAIEGKSESLN